MRRLVLLVLGLGAACVGRDAAPTGSTRVAAPHAPAAGDARTPSAAPPATTTRRGVDGSCDPPPREGDRCGEGDGFCVISWGSPGGHSTALWCRDGRWQIEHERNLPAETSK